MADVYFDPSAATDGTGSRANPYKFLSSYNMTTDNNNCYIKTNTTSTERIPNSWTNFNNVCIAEYGTGDKPIFDLGVVRSDWTLETGNVWSRSYDANVVGNITEDGRHLSFLTWPTILANMPAGSFSFDRTGPLGVFKLYIRPFSGVPSDHVYKVSEVDYWFDGTAVKSGLTIGNLDIRQASVHGFRAFWRSNVLLDNLTVRSHGGAWRSVYLGNGIEFGPNTWNITVQNCTAIDTFDSSFTTQGYPIGSIAPLRMYDHYWLNNIAIGAGLAAMELAVVNVTQLCYVSNLYVDGLYFLNIGVNNWSGNRSGTVYSTYNHGGANTTIKNCYGTRIFGQNAQKIWVSNSTSGVNYISNSYIKNAVEYLATSNKNSNIGTNQNDLWFNVTDDLGRSPSNSTAPAGQGKINPAPNGLPYYGRLII